jgi:WD40 repeat protein
MEQTSEQPSAQPNENVLPEGNLRPPSRPGDIGTLGRYHVVRLLGRGGMGAVFLAFDPALGRNVALKIMLPHVANRKEGHARFIREARAAADVRSDHVVVIYDVGEDNGVPFLSMELLEGMTLSQWLAAGNRPTLEQMLRIAREVALGLAAAHARGLVHRDIKPGNIWLDARTGGRVKILDFGLARPTEGGSDLSQTGAIRGTAAYMSPEQARGEPLDGRADLFSLGCVLYEMSTGERAFPGKELLSVLAQLAAHKPAPPSSLPPDVAGLMNRLLDKERDGRPARAADVADELAAAALVEGSITVHGTGEMMPARDAETLERPGHVRWPWALVPVSAGALCLLMLAALMAVWMVWPPARDGQPSEKPKDSGPLVEPPAEFVHMAPVPKEVLRQAFFDGDVPAELEAVIGPVALQHPSPVTSLAFSPDGKQLAVTAGPALIVWDAETGHLIRRIDPGPKEAVSKVVSGVAYRPGKGKRELWAYCYRGDFARPVVARWDCDSGRERGEFLAPAGVTGHLAFTPDGKFLAIASAEGDPKDRAVVRNVEKGTSKILAPGPGPRITSLAIRADGRTVAASSHRNLLVWDAEWKLLVNSEKPPLATAVCFFASAKKGPATSLASLHRALQLWGPGPAIPKEPTVGGPAQEGQTQLVAHGDIMAYLLSEREIVIRRHDGKNTTLQHRTPFSGVLAFSPDGSRLAAAVRPAGVVIFDAETGKALLPGNTATVAAFRPGEDAIAVGREDGRLELVSLKDGALLASGKGPVPTAALTYSPDGKYLLAGSVARHRRWNINPSLALHAGRNLKRLRPIRGVEGSFADSGRTVLALTGTKVNRYLSVNGDDDGDMDLREAEPLKDTLAVAPDGTFAFAHAHTELPSFWSLPDGTRLKPIKGPVWPKLEVRAGPIAVSALASSPDGKFLALAYESGPLEWVDRAAWEVKAQLTPAFRLPGRATERERTPTHLAISAHGLLAGVTTNGRILIWRPRESRSEFDQQIAIRAIKFCPVGCGPAQVAWSPDGKRLLVQTYSGVVLVFRLERE